MLNRVVLVGNLTRDPELRYTPNGIAVANFTVATNRPYRSQDGSQEADFINCVTWRKQAENLATYMKKGYLIGVDGRIQTRSYENQEGRMVYVTEVLAENIQYLDRRGASQQRTESSGFGQTDSYQHQEAPQGQSQNQGQQAQESSPFEADGEQIDISDDDLPF